MPLHWIQFWTHDQESKSLENQEWFPLESLILAIVANQEKRRLFQVKADLTNASRTFTQRFRKIPGI